MNKKRTIVLKIYQKMNFIMKNIKKYLIEIGKLFLDILLKFFIDKGR